MNSAYKDFPNKPTEAQSYAVVLVSVDSCPVARWIVEAGVDGESVCPFDVSKMAKQILSLAKNESCRITIAEESLESARKFEIDQGGAQWQILFESEVPRHRPDCCCSDLKKNWKGREWSSLRFWAIVQRRAVFLNVALVAELKLRAFSFSESFAESSIKRSASKRPLTKPVIVQSDMSGTAGDFRLSVH